MSGLIYGKQPVAEAERGRRRVHRIWRAPDVPPEELERLAGSLDHQGVVAEVDPYPYVDPSRLLTGGAERGGGTEQGGAAERSGAADDERDNGAPLILALDQIQDPRNLGAIARSAEVAGAAGLVIPERRSATVTAACCKASAGAVEHLSIARVRNLADWLAEAKRAGFWIWGAAADADQSYTATDLTGPTVIVMGGEARGLRPRVATACDGLMSIPQRGRLDSLNAAAAATVLLFEALRQRD